MIGLIFCQALNQFIQFISTKCNKVHIMVLQRYIDSLHVLAREIKFPCLLIFITCITYLTLSSEHMDVDPPFVYKAINTATSVLQLIPMHEQMEALLSLLCTYVHVDLTLFTVILLQLQAL